jgi:hypothetical protein
VRRTSNTSRPSTASDVMSVLDTHVRVQELPNQLIQASFRRNVHQESDYITDTDATTNTPESRYIPGPYDNLKAFAVLPLLENYGNLDQSELPTAMPSEFPNIDVEALSYELPGPTSQSLSQVDEYCNEQNNSLAETFFHDFSWDSTLTSWRSSPTLLAQQQPETKDAELVELHNFSDDGEVQSEKLMIVPPNHSSFNNYHGSRCSKRLKPSQPESNSWPRMNGAKKSPLIKSSKVAGSPSQEKFMSRAASTGSTYYTVKSWFGSKKRKCDIQKGEWEQIVGKHGQYSDIRLKPIR